MRRSNINKAMTSLLKWSAKEEWEPLHREVYEAHLEPVVAELDVSEEELADVLGEAVHTLNAFICEDFFAARFGEDGERNVIDDYLKRRGRREQVPTRRYLEALRDSAASLYEVVGIDPGRGVTLRDLLLGGEPASVQDKLGSRSMAPWDRLVARVVEANGRRYLTGSVLLMGPEASRKVVSKIDEICRELERNVRRDCRKTGETPPPPSLVREALVREAPLARLFTEYWLSEMILRARAPMPTVQNADGEPIMFCEARFPVEGDAAGLAAALDGIEGFERNEEGGRRWTWLAPKGVSMTVQ